METHYSVLMSVYYKESPEYLKKSIESMLVQTAPPSDFVIVCDGPLTEKLDAVIDGFVQNHPELFQILRLSENQGLGNALNTGLPLCRYPLIARMDSDDIAAPNRCALQLAQFQQTPGLSLCSGDIAEFEENPQEIKGCRRVPYSHADILTFARKRNPMNHMAVMFQKQAVLDAGGYIEISGAEDYYLWARMLTNGCLAINIPEILVCARVGNGMYKRRGGISYARNVITLQKALLQLRFISTTDFIVNCSVRILASLLPSRLREAIYQHRLRSLHNDH